MFVRDCKVSSVLRQAEVRTLLKVFAHAGVKCTGFPVLLPKRGKELFPTEIQGLGMRRWYGRHSLMSEVSQSSRESGTAIPSPAADADSFHQEIHNNESRNKETHGVRVLGTCDRCARVLSAHVFVRERLSMP